MNRNKSFIISAFVLLLLSGFVIDVAGQVARPDITPGWKRQVQWILNGQETLTYKTLTSPTITSPTFTGNWTSTGTLDFTISNTTAAGDRGINMSIAQATNALTGTLDGIYARATGYAANSSAGRVQGGEIGARLPDADGTKAISEVVGLYSWADAKIGTVAILRGLETSLDGGAGSTTTKAQGLYIANNTSGTQTTSYAIDINEGLRTGYHAAFTYDMRMQYGETLDNNTDGAVQLVSPVWKHAFDSNDYWTATIANGTAVTFDDVTSGTSGFIFSDLVTTSAGINLGTSQSIVATTGLTIGGGTETVAISSSDWDIDATGAVTGIGAVTMNGVLTQQYDAAAYWTSTVADAGGVTFNLTSDGTSQVFAFSDPIDLTFANAVAGGDRGLDVSVSQSGTALTGDLVGVRGNARVDVESTSGKAIGGYFLAGNTTAGFGLDIARGVYAGVVSKVPDAASVTWNTARGYEVSMDLDQGTSGHAVTITDAQMFYGVYNLPTAGAYATVTNGYGVYLKNEAVGGTGQALDAALYVADASMSGGIKGWDYGIDLSGVAAGFTNADIKMANGETIDNSTNGHIGIGGVVDFAGGGTKVATAGLLHGAGATNQAGAWEMATGKAMSYYVKSTSTSASETLEGFYITTYHGVNATSAAPKGEAGRFRAYLVGDADGVQGSHSTVEMSAGASTTGLTIGARGNVMFPNEVVTAGGTYTGVQAELNSGGSTTDVTGQTVSPLRIIIDGTITAAQWANVPAFSIVVPTDLVSTNSYMVDTNAAGDDCDGKIMILINGTKKWLMYSDDAD